MRLIWMIWMKCSCGCPSGLGNFSPTRPSMCRFPLMLIWHSNPHKAANYLAVKMSSKMSFETVYVTLPPQLSDRKFTKFSSSFQNTLTLHDQVQSWSPVTVLTAAYHKNYLMLWYVHRCELNRSKCGVLPSGVNFGPCHGDHTQFACGLSALLTSLTSPSTCWSI